MVSCLIKRTMRLNKSCKKSEGPGSLGEKAREKLSASDTVEEYHAESCISKTVSE